jgi:hypothetical protein
MLPVLALGLVALAGGCASMSVEERTSLCANSDWYRFGVNDGRLGVAGSERADTIADCAELGHPVDIAAYQSGRAEGLKEYCTVENGYRIGYSGRRYRDVCPPDLEPDFLQGYAEGRDDRPGYGVYPGIGIGIGSGGGVRTGIGVGIGVGGYHGFYDDDCYYRDPFPCSWRRHRNWGYPWGYPWGYRRFGHPYWW